MVLIPIHHLTKPVEKHDSVDKSLPDASHQQVADTLTVLVNASDPSGPAAPADANVPGASAGDGVPEGLTAHTPMHKISRLHALEKYVPGLENLAANYHVGNFVVMRGTGEKFFESMPLYPRLGMHLLFYGSAQIKLLHNKSVENVLKELSVRQGEIYDSPESIKSIPAFIEEYKIKTSELLEPDYTKYANFNDFFARRLKPGARPVENADDPNGICSAADCRLTVFPTVTLAREFWVKGNNFTIPNLLNVPADSDTAKYFDDASLAIFRLAPADYHRFHSPIDGEIGEIVDVPGQYYTVNPQAVNEPGFDVLTSNRRAILYMTHAESGQKIAFVAIGAMLVGSIEWTKGKKTGATVTRGEDLGCFKYGGSTIVAVFPKGLIRFDEDLVKTSESAIETLVSVGSSIGKRIV